MDAGYEVHTVTAGDIVADHSRVGVLHGVHHDDTTNAFAFSDTIIEYLSKIFHGRNAHKTESCHVMHAVHGVKHSPCKQHKQHHAHHAVHLKRYDFTP